MASAAGNFKRISQILELWKLDQNKIGRDLGQHLRDSLKKAHKEGKLEANAQFWDRQYLALKNIVDNESLKKYPRTLKSSATGLTAEQCNLAVSNDFLEYLKQEELSFFQKIFRKKK